MEDKKVDNSTINIDDILMDTDILSEIIKEGKNVPRKEDEEVKDIDDKKPDKKPELFVESGELKRIIEESAKPSSPEKSIPEQTDKIKEENITTSEELSKTENDIIPSDNSLPALNNPDDLLEGNQDPDQLIKQLIVDPTKNDALCFSIRSDNSTASQLQDVMKEIAEELAYLKAHRKIRYLANEDIADISLKRAKSLETLIKAIMEKEKLKNITGGKIDFTSEGFERIMMYILETIKSAFEKIGIPPQYNDIFFVQLAQDLEGFEKKVEKIYYNQKSK